MKKIILFILFFAFLSCTTFQDVSAPFIERYGNPTDTELYQTSGCTFRTWIWWNKKIKVTFIKDLRDWGDWRVYSIYTW